MNIFQKSRTLADEALRKIAPARHRTGIVTPGPASRAADALSKPVLIVGAHPDDEVIGAGILMTQLASVSLVQVSDGAPRNGKIAKALGLSGWEEYAEVRRKETKNALAVAPSNIRSFSNMGIADQEVVHHLELLTQNLLAILPKHDVVITHAYEGGHPDHDATAFAVHAACRLLEQAGCTAPKIAEMTGYNFFGGCEVFDGFLFYADAGADETLVLSPAQQALKRRMFACYRSQNYLLKNFPTKTEKFRQAPRYDFLRPPHPGVLFYERSGTIMTGLAWRDEAGRALQSLKLHGHAR